MREQIKFLNMFAQYDPPEAIKQKLALAEIVSAGIDQASRMINVEIFCPVYISDKELDRVGTDICGCYGLSALHISPQFPANQLSKIEADDLMLMFVEENSMTRSILSRIPGSPTAGDVITFANPATVTLQAEGESQKFENIREIRIMKGTKCLKVIQN